MNNQPADQPAQALSPLPPSTRPFYDERKLRFPWPHPENQPAAGSMSPAGGTHDCLAPPEGTDTSRRHRPTRCTPTKERPRP